MKQKQIEKVLEQNVQKEEDKKQAYYNSQKESEKRKAELEEKQKQEILQKKQESLTKDNKRIQVFFIDFSFLKFNPYFMTFV